MAKRRVTDIARERGLDPNEVARRLFEAGVPIRGDTVDEAAAARALAGSRPAGNGQKRPSGPPPGARGGRRGRAPGGGGGPTGRARRATAPPPAAVRAAARRRGRRRAATPAAA